MTLTPAADPARGVVSRTLEDAPGELVALLGSPTRTLSFLHNGDGVVAEGEFARYVVAGADAAASIQCWFTELTEGWFGRPLLFASLGFAPTDESIAVVPLRWWQRTGDQWTEHRVFGATAAAPGPARPVRGPGAVEFADDSASAAAYRTGVVELSRRIARGELVKAVLSRTAVAHTEHPIDERFLLGRLAGRNPSSYTYSVAGLVGASPELLVRRNGSEVFSRVLAGTAWSTGPAGAPTAAAETTDAGAVAAVSEATARLQASAKEHAEHHWAVESAQRALQPFCRLLQVPAEPTPLQLADLVHLATDLHGMLGEPAPSALTLAASLHPTAAVGGTPEDVALQAIAELEPQPRGRYAGAIGWQDADGDGEFALALRCAEIDGRTAVLHAGGGIVAGSDPDVEAREAAVKMLPIRHALTD